jgi:hypothetical protein
MSAYLGTEIIVLSKSNVSGSALLWSANWSTGEVSWVRLLDRVDSTLEYAPGRLGIDPSGAVIVSLGFRQVELGGLRWVLSTRRILGDSTPDWRVDVYDDGDEAYFHPQDVVGVLSGGSMTGIVVSGVMKGHPGMILYPASPSLMEPIEWYYELDEEWMDLDDAGGFQSAAASDGFVYATGWAYAPFPPNHMVTACLELESGAVRWHDTFDAGSWGSYLNGLGRSVAVAADDVLFVTAEISPDGDRARPIVCRYPLGSEVLAVADGTAASDVAWRVRGTGPAITIMLSSPVAKTVEVQIFDVAGRRVRAAEIPIGVDRLTEEGFPSGVYFVRVEGLFPHAQRAVVLR